MKLKLDEAGHAVLSEGKPVYIADDGKELAMDVPAMSAKITQLNGEAQGHRTAKEAAEAALKKFEGIDDPAKALAAIATVANLDDKKLVDAGEVEKVKTAAIASVEEKYKPVVAERDRLQGELYSERIGGAFSRSKFITDKVAIPAEFVEARFGKSFKIEDGKVVAYGPDGNKLYSRSKPGEPADFEEALELLVDTSPHKDSILKGSGHQGTGAQHGSTKTTGDVSALSPTEKMNAGRQAATR